MRIAVLVVFLFTVETAHGFQQIEDSNDTNSDKSSIKTESITWKIAWYDRMHSVDGERTWLRALPRWERSYLAPGKFRDVRYDKDGAIDTIDIEDTVAGKELELNMKKKEAVFKSRPSGQFGGSPFAGIVKILKEEPIEFVGQRNVEDNIVNVFRHLREFSNERIERTEIWLDAKTKELLRYSTTSENEYFDPATDPDRDKPAEEKFSKGTIAGVVTQDIDFDAQLDPSLFSMIPPEGFAVIKPPESMEITEELMLDWLELTAEVNGGEYIELDRSLYNHEWNNAITKKAESDRSEVEQRYIETMRWYRSEGVSLPLLEFADVFTEPRSFRYLGKGVKLGSEKQLVCFYKMKGTGKYRAVYGDLRVVDIDPDELPLPVD